MPKHQKTVTITILSIPEKLYRNDRNNPLLADQNFYQMSGNDLAELHRLAIEILGVDPKKRFDPETFTYWIEHSSKNQALSMGAHQSWAFSPDYKDPLMQQAIEKPKYLDMGYLYSWWVESEDRRQAVVR